MEIRHRIGLPRTQLHVMNRGARRVAIFASDDDRRMFVHLLAKFTLKHQIKLIAWCLMSNHYHLESEGEGTPLCRMMHDLDGTYARYYNERHEGSGCLFQGRFKTMAIRDEDGLAYVSRYIHANPIAMGIPPEEYRWSSARAYLGFEPTPEWLDPQPVLSLMGTDPGFQRDDYEAYLREAPSPRSRRKAHYEEIDDFYREYLRHLEEKCLGALGRVGAPLDAIPHATLVEWLALRVHRIPAKVIAGFYGHTSAGAVRVRMSHFGDRVEDSPELKAALGRVNEIVGRFR